ncbi:MAG: ABC transporter permease [Streptococcus sp.]|uniref:ABC transporter permease n=1 Tax=Streptococcus gallolyticus TaxID=315405 RepID=A0AAE7CUU9_9STRE|nr:MULTISPECIES: ABC transporter permease [Streptococcus]KXI10150.1 efflux ABC transporter, permease protein [Streptococcus pasteurianus]MCY7252066.1 ABC transporter permease [Streptococcus pasteurianus]MDU3799251.1 ABC transporter permease [Streptococcus sp.]MDU6118054.1 ABC transporter permease [Streptococcus sp.]MDU6638643.1 ABC transporter permease [Streptococcus sp.]
MLGKLAFRNTKRSMKDYLIYLITVTTSFSLIFAFNLVASSDEIVKLCSSMDTFKNSLFAVNILIIFVICFLINYTTKFMFEKRSKELGTYMLLGIKKKEIAHLVVIENILLGILAFVLAIPIGFLFSQFVSLVIVNLLGIPKTLFISLNFVSIGLLIIYFLAIYILVLLNLLRRIRKMTIRDFLYFDKQNEKKMFRDSKKRNVIFVLSIILGVISLFLWNSRCTMDNFNKQETLTYLMVSVIMLILTSLLALNYSSINKASYDISVNLNAPYDVQLFDDKKAFDEYIQVIKEEYTIDNTIEYDIYKEPNHQVQNFFQAEYYDFDPVLKLSDYNRLLELRKMPLLSLNDNEYYIVTNSKFAYKVEDNKDIETITVSNKNLKLKGYDTKSYWNSITNIGRFVVVLPDKYVQGLEVSENHLIIDTKEETDAELENKIKEDMQHQLVKVDENGEINDESYRVNVRGAEIEQQKAMVAIVASLFMYIAFILISAVGTILAVQSLSDSTKYKYRYLTLRRLGINDKSLFKTIRKQLLILFCVPAISAILCSFVMMSSLNNVYQQILGDKYLYLMYFGLNLIIFFLIYSIYWIATYIGFKRNINEES